MNKKIRFNVLDFSIIIFTVLSLFVVIFWNDIRIKFMYEEKNGEYEFVANGLSEEMVNSLEKDEKLLFSDNGLYAGTLTSYTVEKEVLEVVLVDGSIKTYEGDSYRIIGKATTTGRIKENGFYISDEYFTVPGKTFKLETSKFNFEAKVLDIKY